MRKELISKLLSELEGNPLNDANNAAYRQAFVENLKAVPDARYDKVKQLLCGNEKFNTFKFNQGVAELLVWFFCENSKMEYKTEVPENPENNCNIDVVATHRSIKYNIEVKSPEYAVYSPDTLVGRYAHRSGERELAQKQMDKLKKLFQEQLPVNGYNSVQTAMPSDNKIKDCLISCRSKFTENSADSLNILFVCTTTEEMMYYFGYLTNPASGLLTANSFCDTHSYDKVFAVVLSNAITLNERRNADAWDLRKAINLIVPNNFCAFTDKQSFADLLEFFPNNTLDYLQGLMKFADPDMPEMMYFPDFAARLGFNMNKEHKR